MVKTKNRKKDRRTRQSSEILKAQLSSEKRVEKPKTSLVVASTPIAKVPSEKISVHKMQTIDDKLIKKDLTKTIVLSAIAFATIITLWALNITSFNF